MIPPDSFIPTAEKLETWQKAKETSNWVIAINISAKQFLEDDFIDIVKKYIKKYN